MRWFLAFSFCLSLSFSRGPTFHLSMKSVAVRAPHLRWGLQPPFPSPPVYTTTPHRTSLLERAFSLFSPLCFSVPRGVTLCAIASGRVCLGLVFFLVFDHFISLLRRKEKMEMELVCIGSMSSVLTPLSVKTKFVSVRFAAFPFVCSSAWRRSGPHVIRSWCITCAPVMLKFGVSFFGGAGVLILSRRQLRLTAA
eukprot:RCo004570